jgi:hypothetical protein
VHIIESRTDKDYSENERHRKEELSDRKPLAAIEIGPCELAWERLRQDLQIKALAS